MNQAEVHSAGGSLLERGGARARYIYFFERRRVQKDPDAASLSQPLGYIIAKRPLEKEKIQTSLAKVQKGP
jgi:hypothetical protein